MNTILFFLALNILFFIWGFFITRLFPAVFFRYRLFLAPITGYALLAILITALYRTGLAMSSIFTVCLIISGVLFIILCAFYVRNFSKYNLKIFFTDNKSLIAVLFAGAFLLLAPALIGGVQFTLFQGNIFDTFGYLNSAVVYSNETYNTIKSFIDNDFLVNPLFSHAQTNLSIRPSVAFLYGFLLQFSNNQFQPQHYTYLLFFVLQLLPALFFTISNLFCSQNKIAAPIISLAFTIGFYSQYVLDINAWSQIAAMPVLMLTAFIFIFFLLKSEKILLNHHHTIKILILFTFFSAASLYIYPEAISLYAAGLAGILSVYIIKNRKSEGLHKVLFFFLSSVILTVIIGFFYYEGTLKLIINQLLFSVSQKIDWWYVFQAYFLGHDGLNASLSSNIMDFVASLAGLYHFTPFKEQNSVLLYLHRLLLAVFLGWFIFYVFNYFRKKPATSHKKKSIVKPALFSTLLFLLFSAGNIGTRLFIDNTSAAPVCAEITTGKALQEKILFYRIPAFSSNYSAITAHGNKFCRQKYFSQIIIGIPDNQLHQLETAMISVGNKKVFFTAQDFFNQWSISTNSRLIASHPGYIFYSSPQTLSINESPIKLFSSIINLQLKINPQFITGCIAEESIILLLMFLFFLFRNKAHQFQCIYRRPDNHIPKAFSFIGIFSLFGALIIMFFLLKGSFWEAGKLLTYFAPFFFLLFTFPLLKLDTNNLKHFFIHPLSFFILFTLLSGFIRIPASAGENGLHYRIPYYPGTAELKNDRSWDISQLE